MEELAKHVHRQSHVAKVEDLGNLNVIKARALLQIALELCMESWLSEPQHFLDIVRLQICSFLQVPQVLSICETP